MGAWGAGFWGLGWEWILRGGWKGDFGGWRLSSWGWWWGGWGF